MQGIPSTAAGQRPARQSCSSAARLTCHIRRTCSNNGLPLRGSVLSAKAAATWHPQRPTNISHAQTGAYLCGGASCRPEQRQQHAGGPEPGPGQPPQPAAGARGGASARPPRKWPTWPHSWCRTPRPPPRPLLHLLRRTLPLHHFVLLRGPCCSGVVILACTGPEQLRMHELLSREVCTGGVASVCALQWLMGRGLACTAPGRAQQV